METIELIIGEIELEKMYGALYIKNMKDLKIINEYNKNFGTFILDYNNDHININENLNLIFKHNYDYIFSSNLDIFNSWCRAEIEILCNNYVGNRTLIEEEYQLFLLQNKNNTESEIEGLKINLIINFEFTTESDFLFEEFINGI